MGSPNADLVFVGEGPGGEEDRQGEPFVGPAGQLLTKMIGAMGLKREDVYICNVVKCRPPNNRDPQPDEVAACEPFLKEQLSILSPKVIVTLGRYATQTLLQNSQPMGQLRGNWTTYEGIDVMPTFHPAYLLRSPLKKREVWVDLQEVMSRLGLERPSTREVDMPVFLFILTGLFVSLPGFASTLTSMNAVEPLKLSHLYSSPK